MTRSGESERRRTGWLPSRVHGKGSKVRGSAGDDELRSGDARLKHHVSSRGRPSRAKRARPVLRAVVVFAVLMGLFYGFIHSPHVGGAGFKPFLGFIAGATSNTLNVLGQETSVTGSAVTSPDFAMRIVRGCDAIEPVAAFAAAVLASPVSLWFKAWGILVGVLALQVINLIRIVSLFFVGVYFPRALDVVHIDVWQAVFVVLAICFWAIWVQWATRPRTG